MMNQTMRKGVFLALRGVATTAFLSGLLAISWAPVWAEGGPGEGTDLEIGGPGDGRGTFGELRDITFDAENRLYVLDGGEFDRDGRKTGNFLIQRFDNDGKFLSQFPIFVDALGEKNDPLRLAVTSRGDVFVTQPRAGLVQRYAADGRLLRSIDIPHAWALTLWKVNGHERIAVMPARYHHNQWHEFDRLHVLDAEGNVLEPVVLGRPLARCEAMTADRQGNLYLLADLHQIFKFAPDGRLLTVIGGGSRRRTNDGSELQHAVAVDSRGRIYAQAWGQVARFDAEISEVALKEGRFYWYDNWAVHGSPTPFAIDANDRLWVGTVGNVDGRGRLHFRPCVVRTRTDFFDGVTPQSTRLLGLDAAVTIDLPYHIAYEPAPVPVEFVISPAHRRVHDVTVQYRVYDLAKNEIAAERFDLRLENDVEARRSLSFTPPRWGWYTVECRLYEGDEHLLGVGAHVGITPPFEGLPRLAEEEAPGGWNDIPRTAFCGLRLHRVNTGQGAEEIERQAALAEKYGVSLLVQFQDAKDCAPEKVREIVGGLRGKVRYWEVVNEPNLSMRPDEYAALLKATFALVKEIDPQAQVLGPAVCGINLDWIESFYQAGGGQACDIFSIHDYEGNESIDPGHWEWKVGELRQLMARYGDGEKPLWQTERGVPGIRGNTFLGGAQAVRVTLQRDVLETLGIPSERNFYYYVNQAGYGAYPAYIWSHAGPHPAALALRTREAMTGGRRFAGKLDFGPTGNRLFLGLRHAGADGSTITLRNLGSDPLPLELAVTAGDALTVVDSFGNEQSHAVKGGQVRLDVPALPIYLRLAPGQDIRPPSLDFGRNLAAEATITYSAATESDMAVLTNGVLEVTHAGNPHQGQFWKGEFKTSPQTLELTFPEPRTVQRVLVHSMRADNPHCALLDFDIESHDGRRWMTAARVRTHCPPSDPVRLPDSRANTWYLDQNLSLVEFAPVETARLRLVVRRATQGFMPDVAATRYADWSPGGDTLHLRELEIYGPDESR